MIMNKAMADIKAVKEHLGLNLNNDLTLDRFGFQTGIRLNQVAYKLNNKVPSSVQADFNGDMDFTLSPSYHILENANLFLAYNRSGFYMPIGHYKLDMEKNDPTAQAKDLKPEQYQTWEAGFKHQMNKALNYSVICYLTKVEDKVTSAYTGTTFVGYRNAGTATHKGIEVEVDGHGFGEQYEDNGNSLKVNPTHLVDLKLTWVYGRFEWTLACANLFDTQWEKYSNSTGQAHSRFTGGMGGIYPQDGRYLGASVSFRF